MAHERAEHRAQASRTTPKDFFLWLGAIIALYASIVSFLALIFQYVDLAFPDPLSYSADPFSSGMRISMATLIVMVPLFLALLLIVRRDIVREPGKANIWARRWALVLTIFLASLTAAIDLITLLTTYLGGELTTHFALKASVVLLLAVLVCLHFLADYRGYWTLHREKVNMVGAGVGALAIMTIIAGFLLIGSPSHLRELRYDSQRVSDLENLQIQIISYWQREHALPSALNVLDDALTGYHVPSDPSTGAPYEYVKTGTASFTLCATFRAPSQDAGKTYPRGMTSEQDFMHAAGRTCFTRTIDPNKYPTLPHSVS